MADNGNLPPLCLALITVVCKDGVVIQTTIENQTAFVPNLLIQFALGDVLTENLVEVRPTLHMHPELYSQMHASFAVD